jgi:5-methylcytosine-specific restriction endonuclease McrA
MSSDWPFCRHARASAPRARHYRTGLVRYWRQCLDCGNPVGSQISKAEALHETNNSPARFDELAYVEGRKRADAFYSERARARDAEWAERRAWYDAYLTSPEWRARREKVMRRANGVCEGCLASRAVHVHHLTYAHVGRELLFELVAVCESCHELAHNNAGSGWYIKAMLDGGAP